MRDWKLIAIVVLLLFLAFMANSNALGGLVVLIVLGAPAVFVYCLPGYIATRRRHRNRNAIWALTILCGWTVLGWVGVAN